MHSFIVCAIRTPSSIVHRTNCLRVLQANLEEEKYSRSPSQRAHHVVHLHHPLVIHNHLPYALSLGEEGYSMVLIGSGNQTSLNYTKLSQTKKFLVEVYCS